MDPAVAAARVNGFVEGVGAASRRQTRAFRDAVEKLPDRGLTLGQGIEAAHGFATPNGGETGHCPTCPLDDARPQGIVRMRFLSKASQMIDDEPNIVTSGKSQRVVVDGYTFSIEIHRLKTDATWVLEVVDHEGASHVWEEQFASDLDARNAAIQALESEGAAVFMRGDNVVPFRKG